MDQIRIVFLGTSAGMPSRTRNVAAVAVVMDGRVLLFDCGEGTQQQLLRCEQVRSGGIEAIFITHLHGDHLFGLPGLLSSLGLGGRRDPLIVYGPPGLAAYLRATPYLNLAYELQVIEIEAGEVRRGSGYRVRCAPVVHHARCFAYRVDEDDRPGKFDAAKARALGVPAGPAFGALQRGEDWANVRSADVVGPPRRGRSIVYCTDTRPCDSAIELARDAHVLIHESTYDASLSEEAMARDHSTATEAAGVARDAGVERLILTHISPRYESSDALVDEARLVFAQTDAASDFAVFEVPRGD
ncbi:MAG TPA: ribonuclease Z [Thermoanaerobaculia bacterium]|nr:ribonuclease Z [Thermoanaerobaculia bacterium]